MTARSRSIHQAGVATSPCCEPAPAVGEVGFGALGRLTPISNVFGYDRGQCIDRYYIERFLKGRANDIRGRVLEVADDKYTRKFGGERVTRSDVVHAVEGNRKATMVADLAQPGMWKHGLFDCIILTQTLQHIYDTPAVLSTLHQALKPGGVVLATVPGISQVSRYDMDRWGDYWRFTTLSARRLFENEFEEGEIEVEAFGNVLVAIAFLHGMVTEELSGDQLDHRDPDYEVLITVRARKLGG